MTLSPDIAVCEKCLAEMRDKNDRRYGYPLINCTDCGPRYSIIRDIPYDRAHTSMSHFVMCEACESECQDPCRRRFHAEPISCYRCGLSIEVFVKESKGWSLKHFGKESESIAYASQAIREGKIVALKGMGGYHLLCNATDSFAVETLRKRKNRPLKPFALMFKSLDHARRYALMTPKEEETVTSKEKPIVIVKKRVELEGVAPHIDRYGIFLAYTPLHFLLFDSLHTPLVVTSANLSDSPVIYTLEEVKSRLFSVVDLILDHKREIVNACDDSVVQVIEEEVMITRNARGFAPISFTCEKREKVVLAVGANQKKQCGSLFFRKNRSLTSYR